MVKAGDLVKCVERGAYRITNGASYEVLGIRKNGDHETLFLIRDNDGKERECFDWRFKAFEFSTGPGAVNYIGIDPAMKKEKSTMLKVISNNFKNVDDALLVEKHFGEELKDDDFTTNLFVSQNKDAYRAEAKRLEAEEKKRSE